MSEERPSTAESPAEQSARIEHPAENRTEPISHPTPVGSSSCRAGPQLSPGDRLADRFTVVRFVAQGGMGEVYEVWDDALRTRVALKTIRPELGSDSEALERFRREVLLARRISHPSVCRIYDQGSGEVGGETLHFLTMEFLDGQTLSQLLRSRGRLVTSDVMPLLRQIAAGLDAAHAEGVVHRDFKSSNVILVARDGTAEIRPVITDFGIARAQSAADLGARVTGSGRSVRRSTWPPSRWGAARSGRRQTSTPWASCSTRCSPGIPPSWGHALPGRAPAAARASTSAEREHSRPPAEVERGRAALPGGDPERRFRSAGELIQFLETGIRPPRRRVRPRFLGAVLVGVLAVAVALGLLLRDAARDPRGLLSIPAPRRSEGWPRRKTSARTDGSGGAG